MDTVRKKYSPQEIVGNNISKIRHECGLSQEELADRAGLHRTYISGIERGQRNVSINNLFSIATALGCSPCDLVLLKKEN